MHHSQAPFGVNDDTYTPFSLQYEFLNDTKMEKKLELKITIFH